MLSENREISFKSTGHGFSYDGSSGWMSITTPLSDTQKTRIENLFREFRMPGILRPLRRRLEQPYIIETSRSDSGELRLIFRDKASRLRIARSCRAQIELAQLVADTLGWGQFTFQHLPTKAPKVFNLTRPGMRAKWEAEDITPPEPPRLQQPRAAVYRHT